MKRLWRELWWFLSSYFWRFSRQKHGIYKLSRAGISKGCDFEGSVEQSRVFTVFSMVHGVHKLSRASISKGCNFEGSVEQGMVWTVCSMVFTSSVKLAFQRDAILKAQLSKAWYLLCLAEESMVFTSSVELAFRRDAILKAQSSKTWYSICLAWCLQAQSSWHFEGMRFWMLSRAKHCIDCV